MSNVLRLPIVDLASDDEASTVVSIRQACTEFGFFYLVNHGVNKDLFENMFAQSKNFFSLPLEEKVKLARKQDRGYSATFEEKLDPASNPKGDFKELVDMIGPMEDDLNQWPKQGSGYKRTRPMSGSRGVKSFRKSRATFFICIDCFARFPSTYGRVGPSGLHPSFNRFIFFDKDQKETLPTWRENMDSYYTRVLHAGRKLLSLIALSLNLEKTFFEKVGALDNPMVILRLLHYPGVMTSSLDEQVFGASAHSDYGMITLLATDGTPGLQVCREKDNTPRLWEDVPHIDGAFITNIGDMIERWTNCQYRSTLHRVMPIGRERYSIALFIEPDVDCLVECIESCSSESCPPRFLPVRSGDYLEEKFKLTFS